MLKNIFKCWVQTRTSYNINKLTINGPWAVQSYAKISGIEV